MKRSSTTALLLLFLAIITTFSLVVFVSYTANKNVVRTEAEEDIECPVRILATIEEELEDGTTQPFTIDSEVTDPQLWGISDTINQPPYSQRILAFNNLPIATYQMEANKLTFAESPIPAQIYPIEQDITVTAYIDDSHYDIVRRDITNCTNTSGEDWLCGRPGLGEDLHRITNISFQCDIDLEIGWVIRKRDENKPAGTAYSSFGQSQPADFLIQDLNGDGTVSGIDLTIVIESYGLTDPLADVNKDGKVNILDYDLITQAIRNQN